MSLLSNCNVNIVNNTIFNVRDGVSGLCVNSTINGNKFIGVSNLALSVSSANLTIENNSFSDTSMAIAILSSNITVKNI